MASRRPEPAPCPRTHGLFQANPRSPLSSRRAGRPAHRQAGGPPPPGQCADAPHQGAARNLGLFRAGLLLNCFRALPIMNETLIVVPTYNERENLSRMAQRLLALPVPVDLLVVDDNSPDGTGKIADGLAAEHPSIHV